MAFLFSLCLSKPDGNGDDDHFVEERKAADGKSLAVTSYHKPKISPSLEKVRKYIIVLVFIYILKRSVSTIEYFSAGLEEQPSHAVYQQKIQHPKQKVMLVFSTGSKWFKEFELAKVNFIWGL